LKGQQSGKKGLRGALARHVVNELQRKDLQEKSELQKTQTQLKQKSMKSGHSKKQKQQQKPAKAFIPFAKDSKILLVGEGDFTFAKSIVEEAYIEPHNLIATSYDSLDELKAKYPGVEDTLAVLQEFGVDVRHEIDATNLLQSLKLNPSKPKSNRPLFSDRGFLDYIMFNFPHTGRGMKDVDRNIRDHQNLLLAYFKSCKSVFKLVNNQSQNDFGGYQPTTNKGKIILSLFEGEPYISWGVKILGRSEDYRVERSGKFEWQTFPQYHHKRTNGIRGTTKPAAERDARIYVFEQHEKKEQNPKNDKNESDDD
jgi:25S rRNA (uracil2634-N3)-methyltransferase